jgi:hypothetical protein
MGPDSLLAITTISQYSLFLGIVLVLFGWMEKKEKLVLAGQAIFLLLGMLSLWVLLANTIAVPVANGNPIPKEAKILGYFKLTAYFAGFNLISLLLNLLKVRYHKYSVYLIVFIGLMLFFMVFSILQMQK